MTAIQAVRGRETIKLGPFLRALLAEVEIGARARHVTLDALLFLEEIKGNARLLRRPLLVLVGEALRRAPTGTNVTVVVSPRERQAQFRVAGEGAGMSAEARDRALEATAACGAQLSVTETDERTVACLSVPWEARGTSAREISVRGKTTPGIAKTRRALARHESGVYARAGEPKSKPAGGAAPRRARASGKET
jgi:hypothetical protein